MVLFVLAAIRFLARGYFDTILTVQQSAGLFFILAFGMTVRGGARVYMRRWFFAQASGEVGLVAANGGFLSKYSVGIYSTRPAAWRRSRLSRPRAVHGP